MANNKLREALAQAELFVGNIVRHGHQTLVPGDKCTACDGAEELRDMICAALAAPPRQCDVGTVEEQFARFRRFCKKDSMDSFEATAYCAYECPCGNNYDCKLAWAQMPYEKGEAK